MFLYFLAPEIIEHNDIQFPDFETQESEAFCAPKIFECFIDKIRKYFDSLRLRVGGFGIGEANGESKSGVLKEHSDTFVKRSKWQKLV